MKTEFRIESDGINPKANKQTQRDIDLSVLLEHCLGKTDFLKDMVDLFKANILEFVGKAKMEIEAGHIEEVRLAAHKIKHGLALLGCDSLHSIVVQMENECKTDGDLRHLEFLYTSFIEEYPRVENALDQGLRNLFAS